LKREAEGVVFKKHGFKLDGETTFQGLGIAIENGVGSTRKGKDADGTPWSITYKSPYGYVRGTKGADGEEVDCYVGPERDADTAYVVHQKKDDGSYDEDTVMLGYASKADAKADILRHYSNPKYVGEVVPVAMDRLQKLFSSGEKLVKISAATHDYDYPELDPHETGGAARPWRRREEAPPRDEVEIMPTPKVEQRGDYAGTSYAGTLATPGGFEDLGKTAQGLRALNYMSRDWVKEGMDPGTPMSPPRFPKMDRVRDNTLELQSHGLHVNDISPEYVADNKEAAARRGFFDHLQKVAFQNGIPPWRGSLGEFEAFVSEKLAEVTREQANEAVERLDAIEHSRPTLGQLSRGALIGSLVGPISSNTSKLISSGHLHSPRDIAGQIAGGVVFGTAAPLLKYKVESGAERKVLEDYINQGHGGRLATQIEHKLGES
jgi:hypothetical protein